MSANTPLAVSFEVACLRTGRLSAQASVVVRRVTLGVAYASTSLPLKIAGLAKARHRQKPENVGGPTFRPSTTPPAARPLALLHEGRA